ncbi:hypothetical protein ANN_27338 [Periplaneta americana]|uniref:Helix-turn-helix domain-containing protein n=1 Tax=Periplaneta americana TaxID=6978 RepID=A0ABQ8RXU5_PERAM|nr:hypothetical protein ANN_27338 [Periplaneta americana]
MASSNTETAKKKKKKKEEEEEEQKKKKKEEEQKKEEEEQKKKEKKKKEEEEQKKKKEEEEQKKKKEEEEQKKKKKEEEQKKKEEEQKKKKEEEEQKKKKKKEEEQKKKEKKKEEEQKKKEEEQKKKEEEEEEEQKKKKEEEEEQKKKEEEEEQKKKKKKEEEEEKKKKEEEEEEQKKKKKEEEEQKKKKKEEEQKKKKKEEEEEEQKKKKKKEEEEEQKKKKKKKAQILLRQKCFNVQFLHWSEEVKVRGCKVWTVVWIIAALMMPLTLRGVAAVTGRPERASSADFFEELAPPGDVAMILEHRHKQYLLIRNFLGVEEIRREVARAVTKATIPKPNISREENRALQMLGKNDNLVVLPADKGNATVFLSSTQYQEKIDQLLNDPAYKILKKDPTSSVERRTNQLIKKSSLRAESKQLVSPSGSIPPRLYGLPKIHKPEVPLRPIVDAIGSPMYRLARYLTNLLQPLFTMEVEMNGKLPFLDILISRNNNGSLGHAVYRKPTHTNLYLNANSFHHKVQRMGILNTLAHRAVSISDPEQLDTEFQHLKLTLQQNGYLAKDITASLNRARHKKQQQPITDSSLEAENQPQPVYHSQGSCRER